MFHIAERHAGLLPEVANARARAIMWMFAALNRVEPPILELGTAKAPGERQALEQGPPASGRGSRWQSAASTGRPGNTDGLDELSGILNGFPNLSDYVARGEARPADERAFDAQAAINTAQSPGG